MPRYVYRCQHCGEMFERVKSIKKPTRARCPACKKYCRSRITGGGGFILRGEWPGKSIRRENQLKELQRDKAVDEIGDD